MVVAWPHDCRAGAGADSVSSAPCVTPRPASSSTSPNSVDSITTPCAGVTNSSTAFSKYADGAALYQSGSAADRLRSHPPGCAAVGVGNCGFQTDHNVTLYTSPDLVTWTNAGIAFSATGNLPPHSVLFAPKTVYNAQTQQWVMVRCARENQRTFGVRWRYWRALAGVAGAASICCCVNERPRSHAPPSLALPPVV